MCVHPPRVVSLVWTERQSFPRCRRWRRWRQPRRQGFQMAAHEKNHRNSRRHRTLQEKRKNIDNLGMLLHDIVYTISSQSTTKRLLWRRTWQILKLENYMWTPKDYIKFVHSYNNNIIILTSFCPIIYTCTSQSNKVLLCIKNNNCACILLGLRGVVTSHVTYVPMTLGIM